MGEVLVHALWVFNKRDDQGGVLQNILCVTGLDLSGRGSKKGRIEINTFFKITHVQTHVHSWERGIHTYLCLALTAFGVLSIRVNEKRIECFFKFFKRFPVDTITGFGSIYSAGDEFGI